MNIVTVGGGRSHALELLPHGQVGGEKEKDTSDLVYAMIFMKKCIHFPSRESRDWCQG